MPVEIKELHIRVAVSAAPAKPASAGQSQSAGSGNSADKDAIVSECVEQVLHILQAKRER
jgi:hypothetical protein